MVDIVTSRTASLHEEILERLRVPPGDRAKPPLYSAAYRMVANPDGSRLEAWIESLTLGSEFCTLPLWLTPEMALPLDLDRTYAEACTALRISG